ncbi:hypothetical protein BSKO_13254 [Bryopsis sp. KO-2023]|nr:hypothetical protein BSKO_13254 [Bryopsis sp. KO-2023]
MKAHTALDEMGVKGEFKRVSSAFRDTIEEGGRFPPESGRYHLYVSYACPWASRCIAMMYMKGLGDAIGLSVVHPTWKKSRPGQDEHSGWTFASPGDPPFSNSNGYGSFPADDCIPDSINGSKFVRDLYELAKDTAGKYTVPLLWDKTEKTIVNNESAEIIEMFNSKFNKFATKPEVDMFPADLMEKIEEVNSWIYPNINNGVYRCGFAKSQEAYEMAFTELFEALEKCEEILSKNRYIAGDRFTVADIRLFVTLIRFDEVYVVYFKTNKKAIREYPNLREYVKEIYQVPGITESVNMQHIKTHYFTSHPILNHYGVVPVGSDFWYSDPHNRDEKFPKKG